MDYSIFDDLLDAVFVLDRARRIVYCNEISAIFSGISLRRLSKGMKIYEVFHLGDSGHCLALNGKLSDELNQRYLELSYSTSKVKNARGLFLVKKVEDNWIVFVRETGLEENLHNKYRKELDKKEAVISVLRVAQEELKNYSENLEKMVEKRTEELKEANRFLDAMINSLDQGLMVFDKDGNCLPVYTRICEKIFEISPNGKKIWDVLRTPEKKQEEVRFWVNGLFKEMIPFEDFAKLGPKGFINNNDRHIELQFHRLQDDSEDISGVVTLATDRTEEFRAKTEALMEKKHATMVTRITGNRDHFLVFVSETREMIEFLKSELNGPLRQTFDRDSILREVHSAKGGAFMFSIFNLETILHQLENELQKLNSDFIDITEAQKKLKQFELEFELILDQSRGFLGDSAIAGNRMVDISLERLKDFSTKLPSPLKTDFFKKFIYRPVRDFFNGYQEMIHELARSQGKLIDNIKWINGDILISPDSYQNVFHVMVHLFRNAVDHGFEEPDQRERAGKNKMGTMEIEFGLEGDVFSITVVDDGRGIPEEIIPKIFDSGFSTAKSLTKLSGRGVGMSAVRFEVEKLKGKIEVESRIGIGTRIYIVLPVINPMEVA